MRLEDHQRKLQGEDVVPSTIGQGPDKGDVAAMLSAGDPPGPRQCIYPPALVPDLAIDLPCRYIDYPPYLTQSDGSFL